ncbi:MAG: hypothetical protein FJY43_12130 [Betaproteobacteria bacterium]|nr:hypothetical protein [Betaproteobacteria bacterium]
MTSPTENPAAVGDADLQRLAEFAHLVTSAQDALSDEMVSRIASTFSEGITMLDRLTRNEGLTHLLRELDRAENQQFLIALSNAFTKASRELASSPPAAGGLTGLLRLMSDPGVQEGMRLMAIVGAHMSNSLREVHRRGV